MPNDGVHVLICPLRYGTGVKNKVLGAGPWSARSSRRASPWKASNSRIAEAVAGNGTSGSLLARNARLAMLRNDSAASEAAKLEAILARAVSRT